MKKVAIIYWSMTGNTEAMAKEIQKGVEEAGGKAEMIQAGDFHKERIKDYDLLAFGCPAMGMEELEEGEFEPMFQEVEDHLSGLKIALFGSYAWNEGQWMDLWKERCENKGIQVIKTLIAFEYPDEEAKKDCRELGTRLAE